MNYCLIMWHTLSLILTLVTRTVADKLVIVILSQNSEWSIDRSLSLKQQLLRQADAVGTPLDVYLSHDDFREIAGHWAVWPFLQKLKDRFQNRQIPDWLIVCEPDTEVRLSELLKLLANEDNSGKNTKAFLGKALFDREPTIIHHYSGAGEDPVTGPFLYPDFAGAVALSWPLVLWLAAEASKRSQSDFTIDAMHELAVMVEAAGVSLTDVKQFCTVDIPQSCATLYRHPDRTQCVHPVTGDNVYFAVKTYSGYHKNRIVVVKGTWAKEAKHIEYYSDITDRNVPTIELGQESASRGHCGKTFAILERFLNRKELEQFDWLVIADDDTLISVGRLLKLLTCYNPSSEFIIGERYGYGFRVNNQQNSVGGGYDYPTGGAGMVFSRPAVRALIANCNCPSIDSPDDMIIGMCAKTQKVPIIHSAAFHQARPRDYSSDYLKRIPAISFHRHTEVDPYLIYLNYLDDSSQSSSFSPSNEKNNNAHQDL